MPKYAFAAGAPPRLRWGANSAPWDPVAGG